MTEVVNQNIQNQKEVTNKVKRGGCLSAFLIAMFIINPLTGLFYLLGMEQMKLTYPDASQITFILLAVLTFINLALSIATWNWKKIGVHGFWVTAILASIINISLGLNSWTILIGFVGPLILTLLVWGKWSEFE
jgi:hypothetical protein